MGNFYSETQPLLNGYEHKGADAIHITFNARQFIARHISVYNETEIRRRRIVRAIGSCILIGAYLWMVIGGRVSLLRLCGWWMGLSLSYNFLVRWIANEIVVSQDSTEQMDYSILDYTSLEPEGVSGLKDDGSPDLNWENEHERWKDYRVSLLITCHQKADRIIRYVDTAIVAAAIGVIIGIIGW